MTWSAGRIRVMEEAAVVDLFCGAGGLTTGLEAAGLRVVAGVDVDERCRYPYETNTSARFVSTDLRSYERRDLFAAWNGAKYKILVGCAPCQPFSTYSRRWTEVHRKTRWGLIGHFARLVEETRPHVVSMENVPPLVRSSQYRAFATHLQEIGYKTEDRIVDCRHFGAPQRRRRLVLLASRIGHAKLISATHRERSTWRDVKSAIGQLPAIDAGDIDSDDPLHRAARLSDLNLARIRASKPGGTWRDWPQSLIASCHRRGTGSTYPSVYGRMEWGKPAPTITGQCFGFGNGRFGHPDQDRALTLREAAALQTFPEDFEFFAPDEPFPGMRSIGRMIGNAVPPLLGRVIGHSILRNLQSVSNG